MTHAVLRGAPTKAQLYLEEKIKELVQETGRDEDRYCLGKLLFKIMKENPNVMKQIEGSSGNQETNLDVLERSVRTARSLHRAGVQKGETVLAMCRNSLEFTGLYFGGMFAGVVLYLLHYEITPAELAHFISIRKPIMIFLDQTEKHVAEKTLRDNSWDIRISVFGGEGRDSFENFISQADSNVDTYLPIDTERNSEVILVATSGSTGLPKAAVLLNRGLVAQAPTLWCHKNVFPRPTSIYFCPSGICWITMTIATIACAAFGVPILYTTQKVTSDHLVFLFNKYKPSCTLMSAELGQSFLTNPKLRNDDVACLEELFLTGSAISTRLLKECQSYLKPAVIVGSLYGTTETSGIITVPSSETPLESIGKIVNIFDYKVVDQNGKTLEANQVGELVITSEEAVFLGYVDNEEATRESFTEDNWFKTGDTVHYDEEGYIYYHDRIKFFLKYQNYQISPFEVEEEIHKINGVKKAVVFGSEKGVAAVVLIDIGATVDPQDIHDAIRETLSDHKRLRGGIIFASELPLLPNGKTNRNETKRLYSQLSDRIYFDKNITS